MISSCGQHDIIASKRCPVCLRPLCIHCKTRDGCCSTKCFESRQKFAFASTAPARSRSGGSLLGSLIKLAIVGAAAYYAARHFGYL